MNFWDKLLLIGPLLWACGAGGHATLTLYRYFYDGTLDWYTLLATFFCGLGCIPAQFLVFWFLTRSNDGS